MTNSQLFRQAIEKLSRAKISNSTNESAWILEHAAGLTRLTIHTNPDHIVSDEDCKQVWECLDRRAFGEPLQYILGSQEFWGMEFFVSRNVLIPRPETELLVDAAISRLCSRSCPFIIDVGTGSGCVAISLNVELPDATVLGLDRCPLAIRMAQKNAQVYNQDSPVGFCVSDLLSPLLSGRLVGKVTAIVANLPYIREDEFALLSREVIDFEPRIALDGGSDGLGIYRRLLPQAAKVLSPCGHLIVEVGKGQARSLCDEATLAGDYREDEIICDSLGIQRIVCLERKG